MGNKERYYKVYKEKFNFPDNDVMTSNGIIKKYRKDISAMIFHFCPKEPKIIFDVGANMGIYSIFMAKYYPMATVYSFEPVKINYDKFIFQIYVRIILDFILKKLKWNWVYQWKEMTFLIRGYIH